MPEEAELPGASKEEAMLRLGGGGVGDEGRFSAPLSSLSLGFPIWNRSQHLAAIPKADCSHPRSRSPMNKAFWSCGLIGHYRPLMHTHLGIAGLNPRSWPIKLRVTLPVILEKVPF